MIKLSKLTDYAVVVLTALAERSGQVVAVSVLSKETGPPEPTVSKGLKQLSSAGVIESERGANGGYKLPVGPQDVKIIDVITAMDGPVAIAACVEEHGADCNYKEKCPIKGKWDPVNNAILGALEGVSLADMVNR